MHGYFEFSGYDQMYELIRHTVRKGSIVIYPRWQTGIVDTVPGPVRHRAVHDVRGERHPRRARLSQASADRVQPELDRASYFGFSFGGIITANLANRYASLGLPEPRAIFLDDPHDGGLDRPGEPALDDSLAESRRHGEAPVPLGRRRRHRR